MRRRGLQIDDPLGPGQPTQPDEPPTEAGAHDGVGRRPRAGPSRRAIGLRRTRQRGEPRSGRQDQTGDAAAHRRAHAAAGDSVAWRAWSGITGVGSFRLPHELLVELGDTARELGLPIGMIVTAAITQLLDQPPEQIAELVDRADDARIHGRRNARRRLTERTDG